METSENLKAPEPMRWREKKGESQALLKCVGCKTHFWTPEPEVGQRYYCTPECEKRAKKREKDRAERAKRKEERAEHKKKLKQAKPQHAAGLEEAS